MVFRSGNSIACAILVVLVLAPGASAWAWPVDGPVLRPFVADGDPYAGGQHRGIDIGAPSGADVRSAATGVVAFVGELPHQGLCLTVRTADGYSVTLVHLGSIGVTTGTQVSEGDVVGTIGPSGEPEGTEPYVYLGIRLTAEPNGYVDPLSLLPPRGAQEQPPASQPQVPGAQPAPPPAVAAPPRIAQPHVRGGSPAQGRGRGVTRPVSAPVELVPGGPPRARADHAPAVRSGTPPTARRPTRAGSRSRSVVEPARVHVLPGHPPDEEGDESLRRAGATASAVPAVERAKPGEGARRILLPPMALVGLGLIAIGIGRRRTKHARPAVVGPRPLRKMSRTEPLPEERLPEPPTTAHPRRRRVALREWPAASRACRRVRGSVRHHGPVSPPARRLRPDGQRNRRARDARHGRGRSRGAVSA